MEMHAQAHRPRPNLLLLVGPKGSGKLGLPYVCPEVVVLRLRPAGRAPTVAESLAAIVAAAEDLARGASALTLDTSGAFDELGAYLPGDERAAIRRL